MRKRCADTYTDCLKASTNLCVTSQTRIQLVRLQNDGNDGNDSDGGSAVVAEVVGRRVPEGFDSNGDDNPGLVSQMQSIKEKLAESHLHPLQYQAQSKMVNDAIALAKTDVDNDSPSQFYRKIITIDMGQNLGLTTFEGE